MAEVWGSLQNDSSKLCGIAERHEVIGLHTTWGFVQVGLDVVTSAKCKHQLLFRLDEQHQATEQTVNFNL